MYQTKMAWRLCILCVSGWVGSSWVGKNEVRAEEVEEPVPWSQGFESVAERVAPATVYVVAGQEQVVTAGIQQLMRDYSIPTQVSGNGVAQESISTGSGVIVGEKGLVLTNHHVIDGARAVVVTLHDQRRYPAQVVGSDPRTDVGLLQIDTSASIGPDETSVFPFVSLGDSDGVRIGEWVLAIGHPFDFQFSVSAGIVSARGRRNLVRGEIQDFIQTDAMVNPGSSGGPLFNLDGEVIGINTAIYAPGGPAGTGISFAIPSNMVQRVSDELINTGRVGFASLGVVARDWPVTRQNPRPGAQVTRVLEGGPAEKAGLMEGDVIVSVDNEYVLGGVDLRGLVLARGVGKEMNLVVRRGAEELTLLCSSVDEQELGMGDVAIPNSAVDWAGAMLVDGSKTWRERFEIAKAKDKELGAVVLSVEPQSSAALAGLAPGDLLTQVHRRQIDSAKHLLDLVENRNAVTITFWRGGGTNVAVVAGLETP